MCVLPILFCLVLDAMPSIFLDNFNGNPGDDLTVHVPDIGDPLQTRVVDPYDSEYLVGENIGLGGLVLNGSGGVHMAGFTGDWYAILIPTTQTNSPNYSLSISMTGNLGGGTPAFLDGAIVVHATPMADAWDDAYTNLGMGFVFSQSEISLKRRSSYFDPDAGGTTTDDPVWTDPRSYDNVTTKTFTVTIRDGTMYFLVNDAIVYSERIDPIFAAAGIAFIIIHGNTDTGPMPEIESIESSGKFWQTFVHSHEIDG